MKLLSFVLTFLLLFVSVKSQIDNNKITAGDNPEAIVDGIATAFSKRSDESDTQYTVRN